MAKVVGNWVADNSTDTLFRAWVAGIINALTTIGLVRTADTGQIDATTVLKPAASSTFQGYAIFQFNDTLQATSPVFIRFDFGSAGSQPYPSIKIQVGRGTNGAGTLNALGLMTQITLSALNSATAWETLICGDAGSLMMALWHTAGSGSSSQAMLFNLERFKDNNGADIVDGIAYVKADGNTSGAATSGRGSQAMVGTTAYAFRGGAARIAQEDTVSSMAEGTDVTTLPLYPRANSLRNPFRNLFGYYKTDIATGTSFPQSVYGSNKQFRATGAFGAFWATNFTDFAMAVRDE